MAPAFQYRAGPVIRRLVVAVILLVLVMASAVSWLAATESGTRWLVMQLLAHVPATIEIGRIQGRLIEGVALQRVHFANARTQIDVDTLALRWDVSALFYGKVLIRDVDVMGVRVRLSPPTDEPITLPDIYFPLPVELRLATVDRLVIERGGATLLHLDQARLRASALLHRVRVRELSLQGPGLAVNLTGTLQPQRSYRLDAQAQWQLARQAWRFKGAGRVWGDLDRLHVAQRLQAPFDARLEGVVFDVRNRPHWRATAHLADVKLNAVRKTWPALMLGMDVEGEGDFGRRISVDGRLRASHRVLGLAMGRFTVTLSDGRVHLRQFSLQQRNGARFLAHGWWQPREREIDMALTWRDLGWPLVPNRPADAVQVRSARGALHVQGAVTALRWETAADIEWVDKMAGEWRAAGNADRDGMEIDSARLMLLDGVVDVAGKLGWRNGLAWRLQARASELNPGVIWPAWPGHLAFDVAAEGNVGARGVENVLRINSMAGRVREFDVTLQGEVARQGAEWNVRPLVLRAGKAQATLQGRWGRERDLHLDVDAADLASLWPGLRGRLKGRADMRGPAGALQVSMMMDGANVGYRDLSLTNLHQELQFDQTQPQRAHARLHATRLQYKGNAIGTLEMVLTGGERQRLEISLLGDALAGVAQIEGELKDARWVGTVRRFEVDGPRSGHWQLVSAAPLWLARAGSGLGATCLDGDKGGHVCLEGEYDPARWRGLLTASALPLARLRGLLPPGWEMNGVATLELLARGEGAAKRAHLRAQVGAANLTQPLGEGERHVWQVNDVTLRSDLTAAGLEGRADIRLANGDDATMAWQLPGWQPVLPMPATQPLSVHLSAKLSDLGWIEAWQPEVRQLRGAVQLRADIDGVWGQPRVAAHMQLRNGSLRLPRWGLSLRDVEATAYGEDTNTLRYTARARSGDGVVELEGRTTLDAQAGWPTHATLRGRDFLLVNLPATQVTVSPELEITARQRTIAVSGEVMVPYARLRRTAGEGVVAESADAQVLGEAEAATPTEARWKIDSRVRLVLGDRVSFRGFGFDGRLGGNLVLIDIPGQVTTAIGELNVREGEYRAYGQKLTIEQGRALYAGGPLTNPGLDVRAVRQANEVKAGIRVRGTLRAPLLELYSEPAMEETEALAYLLLGHPLADATGAEGQSMAQAALALGLTGGDIIARTLGDRFGFDEVRIESSDTGEQASLIIGRYLSPRLYVSYGVGLIEAINTVQLRYQLSRRWQLKAESGLYQGVDVLYTIERP